MRVYPHGIRVALVEEHFGGYVGEPSLCPCVAWEFFEAWFRILGEQLIR